MQLAYARRLDLPLADLRNRAGRFVRPSLASVASAAQQSQSEVRAGLSVPINPPGTGSYPIVAYSYVLIFPSDDRGRVDALVGFLRWCLHEGQAMAPALDYVPLPDVAVQTAESRLQWLHTYRHNDARVLLVTQSGKNIP